VSINSFGIGGSNAHAVIDSAESFGVKQPTPAVVASSTGQSQRQHLVVFSANHAKSASEGTENLQHYLEKHPGSLRDVAYTAGVRRERLPYRSFAVSDGSAPLEFSAPAKMPSTVPAVTFVFTGQGAQWATMGARLIHDFPSVRGELEKLDKALSKLPCPPSWTIADELSKPQTDSRLDEAEISQPLCTALQIAVVGLLRSWGMSPAAVIGHSSGELAAAYASGAITAAEAVTAAYYRGLVTKQQARPGAMAAVGLGRKDVARLLTDAVTIACENSPENTTISGDADQIDIVVEKIKQSHPDVLARRLRVDKAYHSHHMTAVGAEYQALLDPHLSGSRPAVPFYSTVLNAVVTDKGALDASYWRRNLESPVLFNTAMAKLLSDRPANNLFLEIGPHSALAGPLRQIFRQHQPDAVYVPTLVRGQDDTANVLAAAGNLFVQGLAVDVEAIVGGGRTLADLPAYPWNHETRVVLDEGRLSKEWYV
jgi:acyl transferase domain-containing protein